MIRKFNFDYDYENDSLFLFNPKSKSKGAIEMDDLILDFNFKKQLVGIEMLNASKFLKQITISNTQITKKLLSTLQNCRIDIKEKTNYFVLKLMLEFKEEKISAPLMIPSVSKPSPAIA